MRYFLYLVNVLQITLLTIISKCCLQSVYIIFTLILDEKTAFKNRQPVQEQASLNKNKGVLYMYNITVMCVCDYPV